MNICTNCTADKIGIPSKVAFLSFPNWATIDGDFSVRSQESKQIRFSPLRIVVSKSLDSAFVICGYRKCNKVSYMLVITSFASYIAANYQVHIKLGGKFHTSRKWKVSISQLSRLRHSFFHRFAKISVDRAILLSKNDVWSFKQ